MKRRLRKKKRLGEFQEFGFEVKFDLSAELTVSQRNEVLEAFIQKAIEANGLQFGGGGEYGWKGFVALNNKRGSTSEKHRELVLQWLEQHPKIVDPEVGELRDAWHGWEGEF